MKKNSFIYFALLIVFLLIVLATVYAVFILVDRSNQVVTAMQNIDGAKTTEIQTPVVSVQPVTDPESRNYTQPYVLDWAANSVVDTMNFDYDNHEERLQSSSHHFTSKGWIEFYAALDRAGIIDYVGYKKLNITTALGDFAQTEIEEKEGEWFAKVPIQMSYHSADDVKAEKLIVTAVVVISDEPQNGVSGLGIKQWIALPYSGPTP